jgi:transaldolase
MSNKNPLEQLLDYGQSVWYDNIARELIEDGTIQRLINESGVRGVTSNPTIFEKAISAGSAYDNQIRELVAQGKNANEIYTELAIEDIRNVAKLFRPIYEASGGVDGYVSIEVSPTLAQDTEGTLEEARYLFQTINQPNLMIKVPATPEGMPAVTALIGDGINVNVTLIFALEAYEQVAEAYIVGLERLAASGAKPLSQVASVASFFVSRVDTLGDKLLAAKIAATTDLAQKEQLAKLQGQAAIANSKLAYEKFQQIFSTERFAALRAQGAQVQRLLWASTSTKNPAYRDVIYVEELIGPDTVNTMPPQTVVAFGDHGKVARTIDTALNEAHQAVADLEAAGISIQKVTDQLLAEGVKSFADSFTTMLAGVESKRLKLQEELTLA